MHVHVFVQAILCDIMSVRMTPSTEAAAIRNRLLHMLIALFAAYASDIIAMGAGVVPYSRCQPLPAGAMDILTHHLPIAGIIVPLAMPLALGWASVENVVGWIEAAPRNGAFALLPFGISCLSSLNEAIMCMQRVDLPRHVWNTRMMYLFELGYKCLIFTVFAAASLWVCCCAAAQYMADCTADAHVTRGAARADAIVTAIRCFASSPIMCAIVALALFKVLLYPRMATRAVAKFRALLRGTIDARPPLAPVADSPSGLPSSPTKEASSPLAAGGHRGSDITIGGGDASWPSV